MTRHVPVHILLTVKIQFTNCGVLQGFNLTPPPLVFPIGDG